MLDLAREKPVEISLAVSIALEHFAASISHKLLTDPRYLKGANPEAAELWKWHAIEELEHKGLVFDVWLWATRDWSDWKRYSTRALVAAKPGTCLHVVSIADSDAGRAVNAELAKITPECRSVEATEILGNNAKMQQFAKDVFCITRPPLARRGG